LVGTADLLLAPQRCERLREALRQPAAAGQFEYVSSRSREADRQRAAEIVRKLGLIDKDLRDIELAEARKQLEAREQEARDDVG
jgi:hypothetical protein